MGFGQLYGALRRQQAGTAGADVGVSRYREVTRRCHGGAAARYLGLILGMDGYQGVDTSENIVESRAAVDKHIPCRRPQKDFHSGNPRIIGPQKFVEIRVGGTEIEGIVRRSHGCGPLLLGLEGRKSSSGGARVGHIDYRRDASGRGGCAFRGHVPFFGQPRIAGVDMLVDDARKECLARGLFNATGRGHDLGGGIPHSDGGNALVRDCKPAPEARSLVDDKSIANQQVNCFHQSLRL